MNVEIQEGPIASRISHSELIKDWLVYDKVFWRQGRYSKERHTYKKKLLDKRGNFLSGFVPKIKKYLELKGHIVGVTVDTGKEGMSFFRWPELKDITFREDQRKAIDEILTYGRGIWKAPTGSGKTILIAAIVKAYSSSTLILVHTKTLLKQTKEELARWDLKADVLMKQSFSNAVKDTPRDYYDVVIVDEAHHVSSFESQYSKILMYLEASIRIGFTATTYDKTKESYLAMEGLLGPVIGETSYEEVKEILAKPKMKFIKVPEMGDKAKKKLKGKYQFVYDQGIVKNRKRNQLIVEEAERNIKKGKSVLLMVERIEHGDILLELCEVAMPGVFTFLSAEDDNKKLDGETKAFKEGKRKGVIASRIWGEGLNIKRINVVINAVGGKSEIAAIQRFGRGLRKDEGKIDVLLVDMLDTNHTYFQRHAMERLCFYSDIGWL